MGATFLQHFRQTTGSMAMVALDVTGLVKGVQGKRPREFLLPLNYCEVPGESISRHGHA